jgi:hypothetical protein
MVWRTIVLEMVLLAFIVTLDMISIFLLFSQDLFLGGGEEILPFLIPCSIRSTMAISLVNYWSNYTSYAHNIAT